MADCVDCSAPVGAGRKFCTRCGNPVSCPKCGAARRAGKRFCVHDGHAFVLRSPPPPPPAPRTAPATWPRPTPKVLALAGAGLCAALAALAVFVAARRAPPGPTPTEAAYGAGNLAFGRKDFDSALAQYTRALELTPTYKAAALKRGMARLARQEFDEARTDYELALSIDPNYADAYFARGTLHWILGEPDDAAADYRKAVDLEPDERFYYDRLATALYEAKRDSEVSSIYERAYAANSRRDWALWGWLGALFARDDVSEMRSVCRRLRGEGVASAALAYHDGLAAWKDKNYSAAARNIEQSLSQAPEQVPAFAYSVLWQAYKALGDDARRERCREKYREKTGQDLGAGQ